MQDTNPVDKARLLTGRAWLDGLIGLPVDFLVGCTLLVVVLVAGDWLRHPPESYTKIDIMLAISTVLSGIACYVAGRRWRVFGIAAAVGAAMILSMAFLLSRFSLSI